MSTGSAHLWVCVCVWVGLGTGIMLGSDVRLAVSLQGKRPIDPDVCLRTLHALRAQPFLTFPESIQLPFSLEHRIPNPRPQAHGAVW